MTKTGATRLRYLIVDARIAHAYQQRRDFYLFNRWAAASNIEFDDGLGSLAGEAAEYLDLCFSDGQTIADRFARMRPIDRRDLAYLLAEMGVTKAVLMRDFPDADEPKLDAIATMFGSLRRGRAPTSRQIFRSLPRAAQANCLIDCFVRRRAYEEFEPTLFVDAFQHAFAAYRHLNDGFEGVLCASEAWAVIESALSGRLVYAMCSESRQPYFRHPDAPGSSRSPFVRFRPPSPSASDRALMHLLDRGGYVPV